MANEDQPVCLRCMKSGAGVEFPLFPKSGAPFGTVCAPCEETSPWVANPLVCDDCETELGPDDAYGSRKYGEPRCEECHYRWKDEK